MRCSERTENFLFVSFPIYVEKIKTKAELCEDIHLITKNVANGNNFNGE